jgi:hypothetical protein
VTIRVERSNGEFVEHTTPMSQSLVENNGKYEDLIPTYLPETTLNISKLNENRVAGAKFTASGDAYAAVGLNRIYVQLVHRETSARYGGTTVNLIPKGTHAKWEVEYDSNKQSLPEGTYSAHVQVVDLAGGRTDVDWIENFKLDKTMPEFGILTPENNSTVSGRQIISARITDANDINKVLMNVGDGKGNYTWEQGKGGKITKDGDVFSLEVDTATLPEGQNHIVLRATDGAGNTRYYNNRLNLHSYFVDNTAPSAPTILTPTDGQEFNNSIRKILTSWTASDDDSGIKHYEIEYIYTRNGQRITESRFTNSPSRQQSLSGDVLTDFIIRVRAQDNSGNWGNWSQPVTYYYGVSAPAPEPEEENDEDTQGGGGEGSNGETTTPGGSTSGNQGGSTSQTTDLAGNPVVNLGSTAITPAFTTFGFTFSNDGTISTAALPEGSENTSTQGSGDVLGAEDSFAQNAANRDSKGGFELFGLAWYWILAVLAALSGAWWLIAGKRRKNEEQA